MQSKEEMEGGRNRDSNTAKKEYNVQKKNKKYRDTNRRMMGEEEVRMKAHSIRT